MRFVHKSFERLLLASNATMLPWGVCFVRRAFSTSVLRRLDNVATGLAVVPSNAPAAMSKIQAQLSLRRAVPSSFYEELLVRNRTSCFLCNGEPFLKFDVHQLTGPHAANELILEFIARSLPRWFPEWGLFPEVVVGESYATSSCLRDGTTTTTTSAAGSSYPREFGRTPPLVVGVVSNPVIGSQTLASSSPSPLWTEAEYDLLTCGGGTTVIASARSDTKHRLQFQTRLQRLGFIWGTRLYNARRNASELPSSSPNIFSKETLVTLLNERDREGRGCSATDAFRVAWRLKCEQTRAKIARLCALRVIAVTFGHHMVDVRRGLAFERYECIGDHLFGSQSTGRLRVLFREIDLLSPQNSMVLDFLRIMVESNHNMEDVCMALRLPDLLVPSSSCGSGGGGNNGEGGATNMKLMGSSTKYRADLIECLLGELQVKLWSLRSPHYKCMAGSAYASVCDSPAVVCEIVELLESTVHDILDLMTLNLCTRSLPAIVTILENALFSDEHEAAVRLTVAAAAAGVVGEGSNNAVWKALVRKAKENAGAPRRDDQRHGKTVSQVRKKRFLLQHFGNAGSHGLATFRLPAVLPLHTSPSTNHDNNKEKKKDEPLQNTPCWRLDPLAFSSFFLWNSTRYLPAAVVPPLADVPRRSSPTGARPSGDGAESLATFPGAPPTTNGDIPSAFLTTMALELSTAVMTA